jgi:hypothetical protein
MVRNLRAKDITFSTTRNLTNLGTLFEDNAMVDMLEFIGKTEVGKRPADEANKRDSEDIERLVRDDEEEGMRRRMGGKQVVNAAQQ